MSNQKVELVIVGSATAGGALMTTEVENFPGFAGGVQGPELMEPIRAQAEQFGAQIVYDDAIRDGIESRIRDLPSELIG